MNFLENFRLALRALAANKLRSTLTMLGIIIGVGAVVALMAVGAGATANIIAQVQGFGTNQVVVFPTRTGRGNGTSVSVMYYSDYEALRKNLRNITTIAPSFQGFGATVAYRKKSITRGLVGATPEFAPALIYEMAYGRFITSRDSAKSATVAVLGWQTAKDFFGGLNPLGRTIKINGRPFEVVGVLKSKGSLEFSNSDEIVIIPLETGYDKLFGSTATADGKRLIDSISISAASPEVVTDVILQVERILRREHRLKLTDELGFSILSQNAFLDALDTITATLTAFLGFIAAISLLVGGIGVMNIMLVSVTERTREIGLRKAVGARRFAILLQFLIETMTLTFIGGLLGIGLGWSLAAAVRAANLLQAEVTPFSIITAFAVTAFVGLFAGLYPVWRASRLAPIEALRYE